MDVDEQDPKDRLIDTLLREALGKEAPPNLASRILKRVERDRRRFYWLTGGLSAAAAILIGVAVWKFAMPAQTTGTGTDVALDPPKPKEPGLQWEQPPYTPPKPENDFKPLPEAWARGDRIKTDDAPKKLTLGGYCNLEAAAHSSLVNEGKDKAEQVLLESGSVTCQVDRHIGTFAVRTDSGTVAVTGTKFTVGISGDGNDLKTEAAKRRTLEVSVQEGSVELPGWATTLHAGEKGGLAFGVVYGKEENSVDLHIEGLKEPQRFTPRTRDGVDKEMLESIHKLNRGSRVQLAWVFQDHPRVTKIQVVWSAPESTEHHHKTTVTIGEITEKEGGEWLRVREAGGESEKYTPRWIPTHDNPREGNLDKDMVRTLEKFHQGDKVKLEWVFDEHRRVIKIEKLEKE